MTLTAENFRVPQSFRATNWHEGIAECQAPNEGYVLVTVVGTAGSTPREPGSKMVVTASQSIDTIGGGHLEFDAIARAREFLAKGRSTYRASQLPVQQFFRTVLRRHAVKVLFDVCNVHQRFIAILVQAMLQKHWCLFWLNCLYAFRG